MKYQRDPRHHTLVLSRDNSNLVDTSLSVAGRAITRPNARVRAFLKSLPKGSYRFKREDVVFTSGGHSRVPAKLLIQFRSLPYLTMFKLYFH